MRVRALPRREQAWGSGAPGLAAVSWNPRGGLSAHVPAQEARGQGGRGRPGMRLFLSGAAGGGRPRASPGAGRGPAPSCGLASAASRAQGRPGVWVRELVL